MIEAGMICNGSKLVILPVEEFDEYYIGKNVFWNKDYEENDIVYILKSDCTKININDTDYLVTAHYNIFLCKRFRNRRKESEEAEMKRCLKDVTQNFDGIEIL